MNSAEYFWPRDRVVLITTTGSPCRANPRQDSPYADIGTVKGIDEEKGVVHVRWDHATADHGYYAHALELYAVYTKTKSRLSQPEPNREFQRRKASRSTPTEEPMQQPMLSYDEWKKQGDALIDR